MNGATRRALGALAGSVLAVSAAAPAWAETMSKPLLNMDRISVGETVVVESGVCTSRGTGWTGTLQVRKPGKTWRTVAKAKPRKDTNSCGRKYPWSTKYKWTPSAAGTYELREVHSDGDRSRTVKTKVTSGAGDGESSVDSTSGMTSYVKTQLTRLESRRQSIARIALQARCADSEGTEYSGACHDSVSRDLSQAARVDVDGSYSEARNISAIQEAHRRLDSLVERNGW
jgi:hypothetical protein